MDFLSNLPNDLVCHILSFLTTKEAALTSVLSKRWYNLFLLVPNLDIDDHVFANLSGREKSLPIFMDFVDRVTTLHGDSPIKKLNLKCQYGLVDPDRVNSWISNVLQRGVSDLDLLIDFEHEYFLPRQMYNSRTLVELKLRSVLDVDWWTGRKETFLPMLKTLVIQVAYITCGKEEFFFHAFPVLEELSIDCIHWTDCDETISSESLKKLEIYSGGFDNLGYPKSISFNTPRLVYFDYSDYVAEDYPKVNLTNLVEARIGLFINEDQIKQVRAPRDDVENDVFLRFGNVWKLMSGIKHVQKLHLSSTTLELLFLCSDSIPVFNNLKFLCIGSSKNRGWQAMPVLLRNCPLLETLVLEGLLHYVTDKCGDACDCVSREEKGHSLITCPVKKLQIKGFRGTTREVEMIKHFVESFRCLKEMEIDAKDNYGGTYLEAPKAFELIAMIPRVYDEFYSCDHVRFLVRGAVC